MAKPISTAGRHAERAEIHADLATARSVADGGAAPREGAASGSADAPPCVVGWREMVGKHLHRRRWTVELSGRGVPAGRSVAGRRCAGQAAEVRLSVVIAALDAEPFLDAALDSVLREAPTDAEVIVVDDGSRDRTGDVARRHGPRVAVLRNEAPTGPGRARNAGAQAASGDVLAFHDADDLVLPGRFDLLQQVLDARPEIDLVFGNGARCDSAGRRLGPVIGPRQARRLRARCDLAEMLRGGVVYAQATSIRRERFLALGGFVAERGEDWDFALRAALGLRMAYVDREVFAYRQNPASVTSRKREFGETLVALLERFVAAHPEAAREVGAARLRAARASQLARVARLRLADGERDGALDAWTRAVALAPTRLRYRWRRALVRYAGR